jgi:hypothetical protein
MSAARLALRALPLTFLIFVVEVMLAVFASFPISVELAPRLATFARDPAAALDPHSLHELGSLARAFARAHGLSGLVLLALAPWLQLSWLNALAEPQSPLAALARGARGLPRAWLLSLGLGLTFALCAAPWLGLAYGISAWLGHESNAQQVDLTVLACLLPLLPVAVYFLLVHDLARAASLESRSMRSLWRGLRAALRVRTWGPGVAALAVGLVLPAAAHASSWQLEPLPATLLLQSVLLVRLVVRAAWLAHALACVRAPETLSIVGRKNDE